MPTNLRNLLAALGVIVVGGVTVSLYTPNEGVTAQQLIDGASGACVRKDVKLTLHGAEFCDGGGYCLKRVDVARCPEGDGGFSVILRSKFRGVIPVPEFISAPTASTLPADGEADDVFPCACSTGSNCLQTSDGGPARVGSTLNAGTWSGAGCLPTACTEVSGYPSFNPGCPQ